MQSIRPSIGSASCALTAAIALVAALLAFGPAARAAAAGAAPAPAVTVAADQQVRLTGPWVMRHATSDYPIQRGAQRIAFVNGGTPEQAITAEFPGVGRHGPITSGSECLTLLPTNHVGFTECSGAADQVFALVPQQFDSHAGARIVSALRPGDSLQLYGVWKMESDAWSTGGASSEAVELLDTRLLAEASGEASLRIEGPVSGETVDTATPVVFGAAEPGATVILTGSDGTELGRAVAGADGAWAVELPELPDGAHTATARAEGGTGESVSFFVATESAETPAQAGAFAGVLLALTAAGLQGVRRLRRVRGLARAAG